MLLVLDNYDSFTYNLVQYLGELGESPVVRRNDEITVDDIGEMGVTRMVISPGPCTPDRGGYHRSAIRRWGKTIPTLGVCLGHQAIGEAYGGKVVRARTLMHGKTSQITHDGEGLFKDIPNPLEVMRYHSLVVETDSLPARARGPGAVQGRLDRDTCDEAPRAPGMGCAIPSRIHPDPEREGHTSKLSNALTMKAHPVLPIAIAALALPLSAQDTTEVAADTGYVEYHESPISLPLGIGLRIPTYDRVNGVTLPWGPQLLTNDETLELNALVSYRSHLGNWDPSLEGYVRPGVANEIKLYVGRGTFTNDSWIRSDLMNSLAALFVGSDARNYYRADRATLRFTRSITASALGLTPFIGGNIEKDWSTGSIPPLKTPWSFFGRKGDLKMKRPNPPVAQGSYQFHPWG